MSAVETAVYVATIVAILLVPLVLLANQALQQGPAARHRLVEPARPVLPRRRPVAAAAWTPRHRLTVQIGAKA